MRVLSAAVLLSLVVVASANAAISYEVRRNGGDGYLVVSDGNRIHARSLVAVPSNVAMMRDGLLWSEGSQIVALNSRLETWYELEQYTPFTPQSTYLTPRAPAPHVRSTVKPPTLQFAEVSQSQDGERTYAGRLTYEISYSIGGERVKITCDAQLEVTTTSKIARKHWLGRILPVAGNGYEVVDQKLTEAEAAIVGFPTRIAMTITRRYAGGAPMTETSVIEVSNIRETTSAERMFARPANYRHQKPILGAPGR